jgi:hypothetical protein
MFMINALNEKGKRLFILSGTGVLRIKVGLSEEKRFEG